MTARDFLFLGFPLTMAWALLGAGIVLLWWRRRSKWGAGLCLAAFAALTMGGAANWTGAALGGLERRHAPVSKEAAAGGPDIIVVLGGGGVVSDAPPSQRLSSSSLARVVEGIRLYRANPSRVIWFSGAGMEKDSEARLMADTARMLGVAEEAIRLDEASQNTAQQALWIEREFRGRPVYLVTSASHMSRAMVALEQLGVSAVAAPCDYVAGPGGDEGFRLAAWIPSVPSSHGLALAERWISEWLGSWKTRRDLSAAQERAPEDLPPQETNYKKEAVHE